MKSVGINASEVQQPHSTVQRLFKFIKVLLITVTGVIVLLSLVILGMVCTETGSRLILKTVFSTVEQISVKEIEGRLISNLTLKSLHYQDSNDFSITVTEFNLKWQASELLLGHIHVSSVELDHIKIKGQPAKQEKTEKSSEIPQIPLVIKIDKLNLSRLDWLHGENKTEINQLLVTAELTNNTLTLSSLLLTMPQLTLNARSTLQLTADWPLDTEVNWSYPLSKMPVDGQLKLSGNMNRFDFSSEIKGMLVSTQQGFVKLSGVQPEFQISGEWQKLQWPLSAPSQIHSDRGEFQIRGTPENYKTLLYTDIKAENHPKFIIDFKGTGNQKKLDIEHLSLKPERGQANLKGRLSWFPETAFKLSIIADSLNPQDLGAAIPGKLDLVAQSSGTLDGDKVSAELDIQKLKGLIHDQAIDAHGNVKLIDQQLTIKHLQLTAGNNKLVSKGLLSKQLADLDLTISAPNLQTAWPTLGGSLNGTLVIKGSLLKPIIKSNLQGKNIRYEANKIGSLSLQTNYNHDSTQPSKLDFSANTIQVAENKIEHIDLHADGNQSNHMAQLDLRSPLANLKLTTGGNWNGKQWLGKISQLVIDHPQLKKWLLASPATITLTKTENSLTIDLPKSCLIQNDANFCLAAKGAPDGQTDSQLSLSAWPLSLSSPWLPDELALSGNLSAQARLSVSKKNPTAVIKATVDKGHASITDDDNKIHEFPFSTSKLDLQFAQDRLNSQFHFNLGQQDYINAEVFADKAGKNNIRPLKGLLKSSISELTVIDGLLPEIRKLQGLFVADLMLSGNTRQPIIIGSAELQDSQFEIPKVGTTLHDVNLKMESTSKNPQRLYLNAQLKSGTGALTGKGHLDLTADNNFPLLLELNGEEFTLSQLPEAEIIISPKLNITKKASLSKVEGLIIIDKALVEIKTIPESAISPSEDEIILGSEQAKQKQIDSSRLNTNITIALGDNSRFLGFGLDTRLEGKVEYIVNQKNQRMQGRAILKDASYRSYGQDLTIRKGEFLFNGPADNPWLNIEAVRKATSDNITAVLNVTGLLKSPETRIYTEPPLAESEALAYLVTGKSLSGMSKSDGSAVANAAFTYGAGQLSWLSDRLGIDEFEFEQGDKIQDSAVRLGQYLNPDLYIGVTMGLFASNYAANLRYRLSEHFSLATRAGETQRIDLKYHLETD